LMWTKRSWCTSAKSLSKMFIKLENNWVRERLEKFENVCIKLQSKHEQSKLLINESLMQQRRRDYLMRSIF